MVLFNSVPTCALGKIKKYCSFFFLSMFFLLFWNFQVCAKPLNELLPGLIKTDPRIAQAWMSTEMSSNSLNSSWGEWLPSIELSGHVGYEDIHTDGSDATYMNNQKFQAKLTQALFDYSLFVGVQTAYKNQEVSGLSLKNVKQTVTLEAISTYFNLARAYQQLNYARVSENNILKQASSEKSKVKKGSGVATNVLQINQQLYGARANRVNAERTYQAALNNYLRVFKEPFEDPKSLELPNVPYGKLPTTLEMYINTVMSGNTNMRQAKLSLEVAELAEETTKSDFLPSIDIIGQSQWKEDEAGTEHHKQEHVIKLDFTYNIFNGGKDYYNRQNKIIGVKIAKQSLKNTSEIVEENARNFWENYLSSRKRAQYLHNQAKTASKFLEKAKVERRLGKRSLIDVMNGETNYINSISNAVSADTDMALAVYNMLFLMGELDYRMVLTYDPEPMESEKTEKK